MTAQHNEFRYAPWWRLKTRKQRLRYRDLARRAGRNPDWVEVPVSYKLVMGVPKDLSLFTIPVLFKRPADTSIRIRVYLDPNTGQYAEKLIE